MIKKCGDNVTLFCFILFCTKYKKILPLQKSIFMKKILFILPILAVFMFSCDNKPDIVDITLYKGDGYSYRYILDRLYKDYSDKQDLIVPRQVINHREFDNYVIIYQLPDCTFYHDVHDPDIITQYDSVQIDSLDALFDKMLDIFNCYWIITKKPDKVEGPMTKEDFEKKCQQYKIEPSFDDGSFAYKTWKIYDVLFNDWPTKEDVLKRGF